MPINNIFTVCILHSISRAAGSLLITACFGSRALVAGFLPQRHDRLLEALLCVPHVR